MPHKIHDKDLLTMQRKSQVRRREIRAACIARRPRLDGDPAIALYRAERAAAQIRLAPVFEDAKLALARVLADLEQHGKGGRPKRKHGPGIHVPSGAFPR